MNLKEWQKKVYDIAKSKGWYDAEVPKSTDVERHMLIVTEIAEATEEVRNSKPPVYILNALDKIVGTDGTKESIEKLANEYQIRKPEGECIELADAVIRIMDYFESKGWDLEAAIKMKSDYNETRPYRHGGKTI